MKNRFSTNQNRQLSNKAIDSKLSLFDSNSNDLELFNLVDDELIRLSGSKIYYFKTYIDESYDRVYLESRNRIVSKTPIVLWASFDPKAIEEEMSEFGLELTNDQVFVFNKSYIEQNLGRAPKEGDIIKTTFQNIKYEIFEVQEDSFEGYGSYHYNCFAKVLREAEEIVDEPNLDRFERVPTSIFIKSGQNLIEMPEIVRRTIGSEAEGGGGPEIGGPGTDGPEGGGDFAENTTIRWDSDGVAYINAVNDIDGYFALGYVHAREFGDILFGLLSTSTGKCFDSFRSLEFNQQFLSFLEDNLAGGAVPWKIDEDGTLNKDYNRANLVLDDFDRYLYFYNIPALAEELYFELDLDLRAKVDAFTEGVNASMQCLWNEAPFALARSFFPEGPPITFRSQDVVARDYLRMFGIWTGVYKSTLQTSQGNYPPVTFNEVQEFAGGGGDFPLAGTLPLDPNDFEELVSGLELNDQFDPPQITSDTISNYGGETFLLSNEWAVQGTKTLTGKPVLQIDPHLTQKESWLRFISVSYKSNETSVAGGMFAGIPNVLVGHNQNIGWALTANGITSVRFYIFFVVRDAENPELINYYVDAGTPDIPKLELKTTEISYRSYSQNRAPIPVKICSSPDKYNMGQIIDTWYTDSVNYPPPPPCARAVGDPDPAGSIYEIGLAAKFGKQKLNGIRLFNRLNKAGSVAEMKVALAELDTPFYNFMYAAKDNTIGYYSLGVVPKLNDNPGFGVGWSPNDPLTNFNNIVLDTIRFSHTTPLQFFDTLHPLEDLPQVENPRSGWLANNNVTPNYVTNWQGADGTADPKQIVLANFPPYMLPNFFYTNFSNTPPIKVNTGTSTERQLQIYTQFNTVLSPQLPTNKISLQQLQNIIRGVGGFSVPAPLNILSVPGFNLHSYHMYLMALNLEASLVAMGGAQLLPASVALPARAPFPGVPNTFNPPKTVQINKNKVGAEIAIWKFLGDTITNRIGPYPGDLGYYPRFHSFLENLYRYYGGSMQAFSNDPNSNMPYYSNPGGGPYHDIQTWKPLEDLLDPGEMAIMAGVLSEALTEFENKWGTNAVSFPNLFKSSSSVYRDDGTGTVYPMQYGGRNLKSIFYRRVYENGVFQHYEAESGQVFAMTVDFSPQTTQSYLLKPIHGSVDPTKTYFEGISSKWPQSSMTHIQNFGVLDQANSVEEVVINSGTFCNLGNN